MICLSTTATRIDGVLEDCAAQEQWIDAIELRVDLLKHVSPSGIRQFPRQVEAKIGRSLPLICTVRRTRDGGASSADDEERVGLLRLAAESGFSFVDLESDLPARVTSEVERECERSGTRIIWSLHDFHGVPEDLPDVLDTMVRSPEGVAKVAVTPDSTADLLRLLASVDACDVHQRIVVGMGPFGTLTRVAPQRFGSLLSFCSVPGSSAAPGHLAPQQLSQTYRVGEQRRGWPLFAVVGNPIAHSRSPEYHNGRFSESGVDALYVPILVDSVEALFSLAEQLPLLGLSVTIPHKQTVLNYASHVSPEVEAIQAANTLVRSTDGWRALNTDVVGFLAPVEEVLGSLEGLRALVFGAGGASRGVVYGLAHAGANVRVCNRTASRAEALCSEISALPGSSFRNSPEPATQEQLLSEDEPFDVVVNTTSLGMHGEGDPAPWYAFRGSELVYDIVYTPPQTPFIERAVSSGCRIITGDRMFDAQAAAQSELYRVLATDSQVGG